MLHDEAGVIKSFLCPLWGGRCPEEGRVALGLGTHRFLGNFPWEMVSDCGLTTGIQQHLERGRGHSLSSLWSSRSCESWRIERVFMDGSSRSVKKGTRHFWRTVVQAALGNPAEPVRGIPGPRSLWAGPGACLVSLSALALCSHPGLDCPSRIGHRAMILCQVPCKSCLKGQ